MNDIDYAFKLRGLVFGSYPLKTVLEVVKDPDWQSVRLSLISTSLETKYRTLQYYLESENYSLPAKIRVTNYVNALKRAGMVPV